MFIITLYNSKIFLSVHYFFTPQFQTFLPICQLEFCELVIPFFFSFFFSFFFFLRFLRNYVSVIVNIISNNTVLQCYLLWIFVSIRRLLQVKVCIGVSTTPHVKNMTLSFAKFPLKSANYSNRAFLGDSPLPRKIFFHAPLPPLPSKKIGFFSELP